NILLNQTVIDNMEDNFNNTPGTLADKLMAALQGANFPGADARCLADGTSSTTAYLVVYKEDDEMNDPYLRLNVGEQAAGIEPIDILQDLYDAFLSVEENKLLNKIEAFPNPVHNSLQLQMDTSLRWNSIALIDVLGKQVQYLENLSNENQATIDVSDLKSGVYFARVQTDEGLATIRIIKE
ncbi:MAG: T9SS type A sorting domain-containing protein, partial [Marinirhabdus sp.]|nr:T9SS type A sorting domain-containing protein [Marinirhabdus sp.]